MTVTARKPMAHQKAGALWLLSSRNRFANGVRQRGCILADEMGLGKTYTALLAAKVHKTVNPACKVIVLCPKSLIGNWKREAVLAGVQVDSVVSNHAASFSEGLTGPFIVIADEAHAFQSPDSQRTQKFLALVNGFKVVKHVETNDKKEVIRRWEETIKTGDEAQSVYLLTGTPIKNGRPHNLLPLLKAVNHGLVAGESKTRDYLFRYCDPQQVRGAGGRTVWTFNGATNLDELHALCQPSILRRLTAECLDLPEFTRTTRTVELTATEEADYNALLASLRAEYNRRLAKGEIKTGGEKLVFLGQLRRAGSLAKTGTAIDIAEEIVEEGGQVVLFFDYIESARKVAEAFGVPVFDGQTSSTARDRIVDDFQSGKTKVFVGTGAGGEGVTLHANGRCRHVILGDRPWTPGGALQREKRAHRIGQPNAVQAIWLQHGRIDQVVDGILLEKSENIEHVLAGSRQAITFATDGDMAQAVIDALEW